MATLINSECINCGACEPECPNTAIYQGAMDWAALDGTVHPALSSELFYIVPEKCTECVGFFDQEACAAVCPVDACVPDPDRPEAESALLARARVIHPDKTILDDSPSRFRKAGGDSAPAAAPAATSAGPAASAPALAPAAPQPAARVERPIVKVRPPRPPKTISGELPTEFDQLLASLGAPRRQAPSIAERLGFPLLAALQGVLGALPAPHKRRIEAAISDTRFFSSELATAANVFLNLVIYPALFLGWAVASGRVLFFGGAVNLPLMEGLGLAVGEACWRLRETLRYGTPIAETPLRGALYGPLIAPLGWFVRVLAGARGAESSVGYDGFSAAREPFDDKIERARRYGEIYHVTERDDAYLVRLEFPRVLPPSSIRIQLGLPEEMPDYDYDIRLQGGALVVQGRVDDPDVKKITGAAGSFPSTFVTRIPLRDQVQGFRQRYRGKTLEVILPKAVA